MTVQKTNNSLLVITHHQEDIPCSQERDRMARIATRSLKAAQYETGHLRPERRLVDILTSLRGPYPINHTHLQCEIPTPLLLTDRTLNITLYAPHPNAVHREKPCILFSHGWGQSSASYRPLVEALASHGYAVLNIEHPSSSRAHTAPLSDEEADALAAKLSLIQANNTQYLIDQIRHGAFDRFGLSQQIVLAGHSLGGAASILTARADPLIKGCINIDGQLAGDVATKTSRLAMPLLMIFADHLRDEHEGSPEERQEFQTWKTTQYDPIRRDWETLLDTIPSDVTKIKGTEHMDFSSGSFHKWTVTGQSPIPGLKAHREALQAILKFLSAKRSGS